MTIQGQRVALRALEPNDYVKTHRWRQDRDVVKFLVGGKNYISLEREKKWVEERVLDDNDDLALAICLVEDGDMIGFLRVRDIDLRNRKAEWAGIVIGRKDLWGLGLGEEAARLMLDHLFFQIGVHRVYGYWLESHYASIRMAEKLGFRQEGILRDSVFKNGEFINVAVLSVLSSEYINV